VSTGSDESPPAGPIIRELLGSRSLRPGQDEAIQAIQRGDTLAVLATGTGKTLVYQVAARLLPGLTLVISPTLALQQDQVSTLRGGGFAAAMVNSLMRPAQQRQVLTDVAERIVDVLLLSPEQLARSEVMDALRQVEIGLFVVDEAHCVSSWGHDFRPDYLALAAIRRELGQPQALALTATASPRVRTEIIESLQLADPAVIVGEADRPNIWLDVRLAADLDAADSEVLERLQPGDARPAIVYVGSRRRAEQLAEVLTDAGRPAQAYHGSLARRTRTQVTGLLRRHGADRGRDQRVRSGHRQTGRPACRACRSADQPRCLLPGDRPGRTGRGASPGHPDQPSERIRPAAPPDPPSGPRACGPMGRIDRTR